MNYNQASMGLQMPLRFVVWTLDFRRSKRKCFQIVEQKDTKPCEQGDLFGKTQEAKDNRYGQTKWFTLVQPAL